MSKITVKSKRDSFWRAGIQFSRAGVTLDTSKITAAQLKAIKEEPNLVVTEVAEKQQKSDPGEGSESTTAPAVAPEAGKKSAKPAKGAK